jgi:hypothetical protein
MRTANDALRTAERLHRRLMVAVVDLGPQVLYVGESGPRFFSVDSPAHRAVAALPECAHRIAGVFDASATVPLIAAAIRGVSR